MPRARGPILLLAALAAALAPRAVLAAPAQSAPGQPAEASIDLSEAPALLAAAATDPEPARRVLRAIAESPAPDPALVPAIADAARWLAGPDRLLAARALSAFPTRAAGRALSELIDAGLPRDITAAAADAFERWSGVEGLAGDRLLRLAWLDRADQLSDDQWNAERARLQQTRADRAAQRAADAAARLAGLARDLYLATPATDRPALIAAWFADGAPELRAAAFDLVERQLGESRRLAPPIADAVAGRLRADRAAERERAATILNAAGDPAAREALSAALAAEREPAPAAAMLRAIARWFEPQDAAPTLRWLATRGPASDAAAEAAWAAIRAGKLDPDQRQRVLAWARSLSPATLPPAGIRIRAAWGDDQDRAALASALTDASRALPARDARRAAAEALAVWDLFADSVVEAAEQDPDLFEPAARAVLVHGPTIDRYRLIHALPAPGPEVRRRELAAIARSLPASDVLTLADAEQDPILRASLVADAASEERRLWEMPDPAQRPALAEGCLRHAEDLLAAGDPAAALASISEIDLLRSLMLPERIARVEVVAAVCAGSPESAAQYAQGPIDPWIDGLRCASAREHARETAEAVLRILGPRLTPESRDLLDRAMNGS